MDKGWPFVFAWNCPEISSDYALLCVICPFSLPCLSRKTGLLYDSVSDLGSPRCSMLVRPGSEDVSPPLR